MKTILPLFFFLLVFLSPLHSNQDVNTIIHFNNEIFELEDPGHAVYTVHKKYTRLNAEASGAYFSSHYNSFYKIKDIKATIFDASGNEVSSFKKKDFKDQAVYDGFSIFIDTRIKYVDLSYPKYPYTIEVEMEIEMDGIYGIPDWIIQEYNTQTTENSFTCKVPNGYVLNIHKMNTEEVPIQEVEGDKDVYKWKVTNPEVIYYENNAPVPSLVLPAIRLSPSVFEYGGLKGNMSTWEDFSRFIYELNKDRDAISPGLQSQIREMVSKARNNKEKISILYKYLQDNMRYVSVQIGIGGWQTYPASYVEENKYGDCKALSNFMKGMLKVVDIPSNLVLVDAGEDNFEFNEVFTESSFNHMILYVPGEDIWLECTSSELPAGYLSGFTHNRKALLVAPSGGKLVLTPTYNYTVNTSKTVTEIQLDADGNAHVNQEKKLSGIMQDDFRGMASISKKEKLKDYYLSEYKVAPRDIEMFEYDLRKDGPEAQIELKMTFSRLASKTGARLFLDVCPIKSTIEVPEENQNRKLPFTPEYGYTQIDSTFIKLPPNYEVENLPDQTIAIKKAFGTYDFNANEVEGGILIVEKLRISKVSVFAGAYNQYRDFLLEAKKAQTGKIVLVNRRP
jgi:transglutaminase-like putative cysteine protease